MISPQPLVDYSQLVRNELELLEVTGYDNGNSQGASFRSCCIRC